MSDTQHNDTTNTDTVDVVVQVRHLKDIPAWVVTAWSPSKGTIVSNRHAEHRQAVQDAVSLADITFPGSYLAEHTRAMYINYKQPTPPTES